MEKIITSIVPEGTAPCRLDRYLSERFTYQSRSQWRKEIEGGRIRCNGNAVTSCSHKVRSGDTLSYAGAGRQEPPVDFSYSVIYEDEDLLAINKSGNLPVHPSGRFFNNTLLMKLREEGYEDLFPVHRIDRETSGLILFSRRREMTSAFQKALAEGSKTYLAIVHGNPPWKELTVSAPLGPDPGSPIRKKRAAYEGAPESALTRFSLLLEQGRLSALSATIETGRQHQIRAHCLYAGFPIAGDKMYGLDENCYLEFIEKGTTGDMISRLGFHRSALHSHRISIRHPSGGETLLLEAPVPEDFIQLMPQIRYC
jgi:RluA family pseudouridine synthase